MSGMIERLIISNFKSIRHLDLNCKRINLFIGEPNTGKSNILEVIGFLTRTPRGDLNDIVRFEMINELFYNQIIIDEEIIIIFDKLKVIGKSSDERLNIIFTYEDKHKLTREYDITGRLMSSGGSGFIINLLKQFKFYNFKQLKDFTGREIGYLSPPYGENLSNIIMSNAEIKQLVTDIISSFGYRLMIELPGKRMLFIKDQGDLFIVFPYSLMSDTIQNLIFHLTAIHSNKDSIIAFNEPEARAFPYYTKQLAEDIALDDGRNQYFISTHNPYFLISILEKTKDTDIHINVTYNENYETKIKQLSSEQKTDILDNVMDPFFNIRNYIET